MIEIKNESIFDPVSDLTKEKHVMQIIKFVKRQRDHGKSEMEAYNKVLNKYFDYAVVIAEEKKVLAAVIVRDVYANRSDEQIATDVTSVAIRDDIPKWKLKKEKAEKIHSNVQLFAATVYDELEDSYDDFIDYGIEQAEQYLRSHDFVAMDIYRHVYLSYKNRNNIVEHILAHNYDVFYVVFMLRHSGVYSHGESPLIDPYTVRKEKNKVDYLIYSSAEISGKEVHISDLQYASDEDVQIAKYIDNEICDQLANDVVKRVSKQKETEICIAAENFIDTIYRDVSANHEKFIQKGVDFAEDYLCTHNFDAPKLYKSIIKMYDNTIVKQRLTSKDNVDEFLILLDIVCSPDINQVVKPHGDCYLVKINGEEILIDKNARSTIKNAYNVGNDACEELAKEVVKIIRKQLVGNLNK